MPMWVESSCKLFRHILVWPVYFLGKLLFCPLHSAFRSAKRLHSGLSDLLCNSSPYTKRHLLGVSQWSVGIRLCPAQLQPGCCRLCIDCGATVGYLFVSRDGTRDTTCLFLKTTQVPALDLCWPHSSISSEDLPAAGEAAWSPSEIHPLQSI